LARPNAEPTPLGCPSVPFRDDGVREQALADLVLSLRTQAHEYANRLHALSGLLALDMVEEAEQLLAGCALEHGAGDAALLEAIAVPAVAGLLVAKRAAGSVQGVRVEVDAASSLERLPAELTELDAISLLGNFVDNGIEAAAQMPEPRRRVEVGIFETERELLFRVTDRGSGFEPRARDLLFEPGRTSKPDHQGLGLAVVAAVLDRAGGNLDVDCTSAGTTFEASFPTRGDR